MLVVSRRNACSQKLLLDALVSRRNPCSSSSAGAWSQNPLLSKHFVGCLLFLEETLARRSFCCMLSSLEEETLARQARRALGAQTLCSSKQFVGCLLFLEETFARRSFCWMLSFLGRNPCSSSSAGAWSQNPLRRLENIGRRVKPVEPM